jgi:hypothetical protein
MDVLLADESLQNQCKSSPAAFNSGGGLVQNTKFNKKAPLVEP